MTKRNRTIVSRFINLWFFRFLPCFKIVGAKIRNFLKIFEFFEKIFRYCRQNPRSTCHYEAEHILPILSVKARKFQKKTRMDSFVPPSLFYHLSNFIASMLILFFPHFFSNLGHILMSFIFSVGGYDNVQLRRCKSFRLKSYLTRSASITL